MNRRDFVFKSTLCSAAFSVPHLTNAKYIFNSKFDVTNNFGIQLYSLKDEMEKDPKSTLKKLASFGYKYLEGYESLLGLFWGMSNIEFNIYLESLGLKMIASHCNDTDDFDGFNSKCFQAAEIGMDYLICPWIGGERNKETFQKHADTFNKCGQIAKTNGIKFAFHNHDYTFKNDKGEVLQDILMKNTDPDLVDFELDIYWVVAAKQDPIKWFDKYPNRFKYCHVKDYLKLENGHETCTLGRGSIDFQKVISHGVKKGLKTFIVEQENFRNTNPLEAARDNLNYMKKIKA